MLAKLDIVGPIGGKHSLAVETAKLSKWFVLILLFNVETGLFLAASLFVASRRLLACHVGRPTFPIAAFLVLTLVAAIASALQQDFPAIAYLSGNSDLYYEPALAVYYVSPVFLTIAVVSVFVNAIHFTKRSLVIVRK
ncbi:hypothetical protein [Aporhodopirellula aestuarii]|uniref:NADH dehydrogenase subunit 6 n=1 Tax=Aporhodopirellula aestuarii TaxID=2950107 RepID=A0ABT0U4M2_9BACT|nr:hypothetical protein [Aporhodopirellula aestuarii]MCM2371634.1 hypothetical protein [Aporhodopirellula aestuarii]